MKIREAIEHMMEVSKTTQVALGRKMGKTAKSYVYQTLSRENLNVKTLIQMAEIMDFEVVIQPKRAGRRPDGQVVLEGGKVE